MKGPMHKTVFPVGFHQLHPDVSMNFQMNRWYSWVGEQGMLDEMRSAAPRIATYADWKREFLALAQTAESAVWPPERTCSNFAGLKLPTGFERQPSRESAIVM